jgi:hypothetical protein
MPTWAWISGAIIVLGLYVLAFATATVGRRADVAQRDAFDRLRRRRRMQMDSSGR